MSCVICEALSRDVLMDGHENAYSVDADLTKGHWYVYNLLTMEYERILTWLQFLPDGGAYDNKLVIQQYDSGLTYDVIYTDIPESAYHQYFWVPVIGGRQDTVCLYNYFPDGRRAWRGGAFEDFPYNNKYGYHRSYGLLKKPDDWVTPETATYYTIGIPCGRRVLAVTKRGTIEAYLNTSYEDNQCLIEMTADKVNRIIPIMDTKEWVVERTDYGHSCRSYKLYNLPTDTCVVELPTSLPDGAEVICHTPLNGTLAVKFGSYLDSYTDLLEEAGKDTYDVQKGVSVGAQEFVRDVREELNSPSLEEVFDRLCRVVGKVPSTLVEDGRPLLTMVKICETMIRQLED